MKNITQDRLLEHYSGKRLLTNRNILSEYGSYGAKLTNAPTEKSSIVVYFDNDDLGMVPTSVNFDILTTVEFKSGQIREDYNTVGNEKEEPTVDSDAELEKNVEKSLSSKSTDMISIQPKFVDYGKFYWDIVSKQLSAHSILFKVRQLIKTGVISMQDLDVSIITTSDTAQRDDKSLWKVFVIKDRKNSKASPIKISYGYSATLVGKNELKQYTKKELIPLIYSFVQQFETSVLKDTEYYSFLK